jgi:hypothetical protein
MRANWESGDLHASFNAGIDCIAVWEPYHYDASADIGIEVSYRTSFHTFTADLTAQLEIWGPPFSGVARVSWWICSFDIAFGEDAPREAKNLTWWEFQRAFLPSADLLTTVVEAGKAVHHGKPATDVPTNHGSQLGAVNPRDLCIRIESAIPITSGNVLGASLPDTTPSVGVAPVGKAKLDSNIVITINREGSPVNGEFQFSNEERSVPLALWGPSMTADPRNAETVTRALTGFVITAKPLPARTVGSKIQPRAPTIQGSVEAPVLEGRLVRRSTDEAAEGRLITDSLQGPDTRAVRDQLLDALMPGARSNFTGMTVEALRCAPRLMEGMTS